KRMFERDKDVLREAGIPVQLVPTDPFEVEEGYTIPKESYYLPDVDFTQEELSALFVAAHTPAADGEAEQAALKLQAASEGSLGGSDLDDAGEGSAPPEDFDAREQIKSGPWGIGEPAGEAVVAFSPDVAWWAVRSASGARVAGTREDGWIEVTVPGGAAHSLA